MKSIHISLITFITGLGAALAQTATESPLLQHPQGEGEFPTLEWGVQNCVAVGNATEPQYFDDCEFVIRNEVGPATFEEYMRINGERNLIMEHVEPLPFPTSYKTQVGRGGLTVEQGILDINVFHRTNIGTGEISFGSYDIDGNSDDGITAFIRKNHLFFDNQNNPSNTYNASYQAGGFSFNYQDVSGALTINQSTSLFNSSSAGTQELLLSSEYTFAGSTSESQARIRPAWIRLENDLGNSSQMGAGYLNVDDNITAGQSVNIANPDETRTPILTFKFDSDDLSANRQAIINYDGNLRFRLLNPEGPNHNELEHLITFSGGGVDDEGNPQKRPGLSIQDFGSGDFDNPVFQLTKGNPNPVEEPTQPWEIDHHYMNFAWDGSTLKMESNAEEPLVSMNGDLQVAGKVITQVWEAAPDYVFEEDFKLRSLEEVESFVKENKHLPEIPSGKQIETEGIDLASMNMKLLKKIEEMTLHMVEMNKRIKELEAKSR